METPLISDSEETPETLRRKLADYERRFRLLDEQMRILERERQKLSAVVHHTDAGFLVFDSTLKVVWANSVFARNFGEDIHPGALLGAACNRVLCGREAICEHCPAAQPFAFGVGAHHEIRLEIHGRPRHIYATAMPIKSLTGEIDQVMVMLQDVSNLEILRQSQEALKISEERFRLIFERAAAGMTTVAPDGSYLQVNSAFCRFLGYREADLLLLKVQDVTHPDDLEVTNRLLHQALSPNMPRVDLEKRYVRRDGTTAWGHTTATWLFDAQGNPTFAVALIEDINERKQTEEALKQNRIRTEAILNTALDAIISIDHEGRVTEFNPAAERMFGYAREEAVGRVMGEIIVPPSLRDKHTGGLARYLKTGEAHVLGQRIEILAMRRDGTEFPAELAITRIPLDGPAYFTGFVRDISDRKRAEDALRHSEEQLRHSQKMEAVGTLAGGVAHDFNNILTGILGYAELLKMQSKPGEKVFEAAAVIENGANRAAALTQQLLGFARRGKHQDVAVDFHATIRDTLSVLSRTVDKRIAIHQDLCPAHATVQGDPGQMEQVILNLAVNAADAMPVGGELTLRTQILQLDEESARRHPGATPGRYLALSVADTGHGIPSDILGRIFEPFFTTKERGKGTGMGLAMVYGIVQNHGGFIEVESETGRGTTFRVYLPLGAEETPGAEAAQPSDQPAPGSPRVLLVDDEEIVRKVAEEFLHYLGYQVVPAADGREAVEIYRKLGPQIDLVILDMVMPHLNGRDTFRALKAINPAVRAVLSTGYDFNSAAQQLLDEGMVGFIQKPYQISKFSEVISDALGRPR